jgi:glucose uptake protein
MSLTVALIMMITSTICWGSWANTYKLLPGYRFELFYWDYAIGIFLTSLAFAFPHIAGVSPPAVIGGVIFNLANLLLVAAIEIAGLAVAFPLAIGIALVEGVVLSYALQAKGNPLLLAAGVAAALAAVVFDGRAYAQLPAEQQRSGRKGIIVCIISGLWMGLWAPFVTRAMTGAHPLDPYNTAVWFTFGALASCGIFNVYRVPFADYFRAPARAHWLGLAGGAIWGVGTVFNFVAASHVGVPIAYAIGQSAPMVAALWGLLAWHEFHGAPGRARVYLGLMFAFYILGIGLVASA